VSIVSIKTNVIGLLLSFRFEAQPPPGHRQVQGYKNWNPPLLGNLPDDFLRILPQQLDSVQVSNCHVMQ